MVLPTYTRGEDTSVCFVWTFFLSCGEGARSIPEGRSTRTFVCVCVCEAECVLGDASGCGDCPSGGLFLAGPAGHRHEAEDQGPPDEGGERATRCVFTWIQSRRSEVCVCVCASYKSMSTSSQQSEDARIVECDLMSGFDCWGRFLKLCMKAKACDNGVVHCR